MKTTTFYIISIYTVSFLMLGSLLIYPRLSHEALPTSSTDSSVRRTITNSNIQCKKLTINRNTYIPITGTPDSPIPSCPLEYVAIGVNSGSLAPNSASVGGFVADVKGWGYVDVYRYDPLYYRQGGINNVSLLCGKREIVFSANPCP